MRWEGSDHDMADTVRAAVQVGPRQIEIREFPRPRIGPDHGLSNRLRSFLGLQGSGIVTETVLRRGSLDFAYFFIRLGEFLQKGKIIPTLL